MPAPTVSRAGNKLEAAVEKFALAPRLAGALALDIGASTGGFTECMLRHGARRVTAIDVGAAQLHATLRADARVESLERSNFRQLPLGTAPGPYDFFAVDVSFTAARNMLRPLAFRLKPGAEGVVLVKPQFELPPKLVHDGNVVDEGLRRRALDEVVQKGRALGFELVASCDSPVAGREGTVEILAHLRFHGRTEKLPQPGERRGQKQAPRPGKVTALPTHWRLFCVAAPGTEAALLAEAQALEGARSVSGVPGGVELRGDLAVVCRANLRLRTASRVLLRLGELDAENFSQLRRRGAHLPWASFLAKGATVDVRVAQRKSRLYHTGAIAEQVAHALNDAVGDIKVLDKRADEDDEAPPSAQQILVRGDANHWTFSVDTSGALLHRRGYRLDTGLAPLRETLAAAILLTLGWRADEPLYDPMCGAGTFLVEAALLGLGRAPGAAREFACERWPLMPAEVVAAARAEVREPPSVTLAGIHGSDASAEAVAAATANIARAGLADVVRLAQQPLVAVRAPAPRGLLVVNPPFGRRVGSPTSAAASYRELGRLLRGAFRGWRAGILTVDPRAPIGLRPRRTTSFAHGGLRTHLLEFDAQ